MRSLGQRADKGQRHPRAKSIFRKLLIFISTSIASLILIASGFWIRLGFGEAYSSAPSYYAELERSGTPLATEEFLKSFAVPDEVNAAPKLMPALLAFSEKMKQVPIAERRRFNREGNPNEFTPEAIRGRNAVLEKIDPSLDVARGAAQPPSFLIERDWTNPMLSDFPEFALLRSAVMIFSASAIRYVEAGDFRKAQEEIRTGFRLAKYAADTPVLIGYLVEIACVSIMNDAIKVAIQHNPRSAPFLEQFLTEEYAYPPARYLRAEAYAAAANLRNLGGTGLIGWIRGLQEGNEVVSSPPGPQRTSGLPRNLLIRAMASRVFMRYQTILATVGPDNVEKTPGLLQRTLQEVKAEKQNYPLDLYSGIIIPTYADIGRNGLIRAAQVRSLKALIRTLDHQADTGKWPRTLKEIGADFEDPFSPGRPIQYRVTPSEVRIWSIGRDGLDNGGKTRKELGVGNPDATSMDIVIKFPIRTQ